jgi:hypothetical protein
VASHLVKKGPFGSRFGGQLAYASQANASIVMALSVSPDASFVLTTSSEHFLVKYDVVVSTPILLITNS